MARYRLFKPLARTSTKNHNASIRTIGLMQYWPTICRNFNIPCH